MRDGEEQGGGSAREVGREVEVGGQGSGGAGEREEGRPTAEGWVEVPLTKGKIALIDAADMLIVGRWSWYFRPSSGNTTPYAARKQKTQGVETTIYMHRWIVCATENAHVDHINGNGLDNRRINLRIATRQQNARNQAKRRGISRYKGVWWDKARAKWRVSVRHNGRTVHLGAYDSEMEAALCYDATARLTYGDFARLNFPDNR